MICLTLIKFDRLKILKSMSVQKKNEKGDTQNRIEKLERKKNNGNKGYYSARGKLEQPIEFVEL